MAFYEGCKIEKDNLFLAFIVFPLIFNEKWIAQNPRIIATSKLASWKEDKKLYLQGLPGRVEYFRDITIKCIQYGLDMNWIILEGNTITINKDNSKNWKASQFYSNQQKSAKAINNLFNGLSVVDIYATLDIKEAWKL